MCLKIFYLSSYLDSFQSIIDELLKDPAIKEAIEELQKPINEIHDIAEKL